MRKALQSETQKEAALYESHLNTQSQQKGYLTSVTYMSYLTAQGLPFVHLGDAIIELVRGNGRMTTRYVEQKSNQNSR